MKKLSFILIILLISGVLLSLTESKENKTDFLITIQTDLGEIKMILFDDTPIHKSNFLKLAQSGQYDGSTFHRIIDQFMIQGGELLPEKRPAGWDTLSFEGKTLAAEIRSNHKHQFGALSAARTVNDAKRSDFSQFFIVQNRNGAHYLDNEYTVFGQVMAGFDTIDKIAKAENTSGKPNKDIKMKIIVEKVQRKLLMRFYGNNYQQR